MAVLIDTHTLIWFLNKNDQLSSKALDAIENTAIVYVSMASLWEISIKTSIGKLTINGSFESVLEDLSENNIQILPITFSHLNIQNGLKWHHRDPFDRLIVSQAIFEGYDIVSKDEILDAYMFDTSIKRIW